MNELNQALEAHRKSKILCDASVELAAKVVKITEEELQAAAVMIKGRIDQAVAAMQKKVKES